MPDPKRLLYRKLREIEEVIETSPLKAYERLSSLLGQYPSDPRVLTLMSHANVLLEDYGTAKAYAKRAVLTEPSNITAKYIMGICHQRLGEFQDAVRVYTQIAEATPTNPVAFLFLGESLLNCDDEENAEEAYRKAAELDKEGDVEELAKEALWKLWGMQ